MTIGKYAKGTLWNEIAADTDYPLIRDALVLHGFLERDIHHLDGPAATRKGIVAAFRKHLLGVAKGSVVVFHFSGHGHRITDDDGDEIDGYDEILVPWDAPRYPPVGYRGDKHLRDDELGDLLDELRRQVGPEGDVVVFLDSCFSGTGSRGGVASVRGEKDPIGPPRRSAGRELGIDKGSGLDKVSRTLNAEDVRVPAPIAVFAAERHDQLAEEAPGPMGALTWALRGALKTAGRKTTYRDLDWEVKLRTAIARIPNQPQAEGMLDREIFGGDAVDQVAYFHVLSASREERRAQLDGGEVLGLLPGAKVEIHNAKTRKPTPATRLASGRVTSATPLTAEVTLDEIAEGADLTAGWTFVTKPSFGSLRLRLKIEDAVGEELRKELEKWAERQYAPFDVVSEDPEVVLRRLETGIVVATKLYDVRLLGPAPPSERGLGIAVVRALTDYARNRYLAALELKVPDLDAELELLPCRLNCEVSQACSNPGECRCLEEVAPEESLPRHGLALKQGTGFRVRLRNTGSKKANLAILDLMPDGGIIRLWPLETESAEDAALEADAEYTTPVDSPYAVCPPFGIDVLKLFITSEHVKFDRVANTTKARDLSELEPLEKAFADVLEGRRGNDPVFDVDGVSTFTFLLETRPGS